MTPKIGEPRIYAGDEIPVFYPGELATSRGVTLPEILDAMRAAAERGETEAVLPLSGWIIEPDPSWRGALLRWRYRLIGQYVERWFGASRQRVTTQVTVDRVPVDE